MSQASRGRSLIWTMLAVLSCSVPAFSQEPAPEEQAALTAKLAELDQAIAALRQTDPDPHLLADVEVYAKAAAWALRHAEFYTPAYVTQTMTALDTGLARAAELAKGESSWDRKSGRLIRGYRSEIDGSVQPYAISLPAGWDPNKANRWPLHIVLHGRGDKMNEVNFIASHDGKPAEENATWIQLDIYGRGQNAYRWAGETDLFEALKAVQKRYRIDNRRMVLRGFSMGGAGSWHLGLHHPSLWCAVGPGAGFVDFYKYQDVKEPLPPYQDATLQIYDAVPYAQNAFNVPVVTYGGEQDAQLVASTEMVAAAEKLGVKIPLVLGKGVGHKFTPEGYAEYLAFQNERMKKGRPAYPGRSEIKFVTHTLKYNQCDWLTIDEMITPYAPARVEGVVDENGILQIKTENVAILSLARDIASDVNLDGTKLPLTTAAQGLLPLVQYDLGGDEWRTVSYDSSLNFSKNLDLRKRHNLQGPIDDAFMQPFLCVRGTGKPWSAEQAAWAEWTLRRFEREFDKWLRGKIEIVDDTQVTDEMMQEKNLILFGDPGSNSVLARFVNRLPVRWNETNFEINGQTYDPATHGLSMIYPNPLSPRRYIVLNSGHTFHEKDFKASNAWLFPRLGDVAVQSFRQNSETGDFEETIVWADIFNSAWRFKPPAKPVNKPEEKPAEKKE